MTPQAAATTSGRFSMLLEIWRFEVSYQLRQPIFLLSAIVMFSLAVAAISSDVGGALSGAPAVVHRNSPFVICSLMAGLSILGLFVVTAFVGNAALRDFEHDCDMLFFSRPITRADYFLGRFLGAITVSGLLFTLVTLGLAAGQFAPWQDASKLGPKGWWPFAYALLIFAIPNLLAMGAVFFAVAIWSRRMLWTYLGVILFVTLQDAVEVLANHDAVRSIGALLEPLGVGALKGLARYWTVSEFNGALPSLLGLLAGNRLVWLVVGGVSLLAGWLRFSTSREPRVRRAASDLPAEPSSELMVVTPPSGFATSVRMAAGACRVELASILRSPFLLVGGAFAMIVVGAVAWFRCDGNGDPICPTTSTMVLTLVRALRPFLALLVVFFAGELVWRDREHGMAGLIDATPAPSLGLLVSRFVAIASAVVTVIGASIVSTVVVQIVRGPVALEPLLYLKGAAMVAWPALLLIPLCLLVQVATRGKIVGYLVLMVLFAVRFAMPLLGFPSPLYLYGEHPPIAYSAMDGFGPTSTPFLAFSLYWSGVAMLLLLATARLWPRGEVEALQRRLRDFIRKPISPGSLAVTLVTLTATVASFVNVYVNTHVLNEGLRPADRRERDGRYERLYRSYASLSLPRIVSTRSEIDFYPDERRVEVRGTYRLINTTSDAISTLPMTVPSRHEEGVFPIDEGVRLVDVQLPEHRVVVTDRELGFYVFELVEPILPGGEIELSFQVVVENHGFREHRQNLQVVRNGTFFTDRTVFPFVGYAESRQLIDPRRRHEQGLANRESRMLASDDPSAPERSYLDADWGDCETLLSTVLDQTALAPGELLADWIDGERRYFHYRTSAPTQLLLAFASARYDVMRATQAGVDIEIYYHPPHVTNVARIMEVTKASLDRFSAWFGPYPHRVLRIAEIPATNGQVAVSLGSLIGFSESFGFLSDVQEGELDTLSHITAHEVAHQWWNHQVAPARCQGSTFLGESLAEYSSLRLLEDLFEPTELVQFRRQELDRYLTQRSRDAREELPLVNVENQAYVHYSKGALALSAIGDRIRRDVLIGVLREFLEEYRFAGPPYPCSTDLVRRILSVAPEQEQAFIRDQLERIALYDLRVASATATPIGDGTYSVRLDLRARKLLADGRGNEAEEWPMNTSVDVEVRGEAGPLWRDAIDVADGERAVDIVVRGRPKEVAIDPDLFLIDRVLDDNRLPIDVHEP